MKLRVLTPEDWSVIAEDTHRAIFGEHRPADKDRIDYAVSFFDGEDPFGYITVQEKDSKTAYLQFGGVFFPNRGTDRTKLGMLKFLEMMSIKYDTLEMLVDQTNVKMLIFGLKNQFMVTGVRVRNEKVLVELTLGLNKWKQ